MITYRQSGETLIPDLKLSETENRPLGRYAAAQSRLELLMPELMKDAGATEALKASDPMRWVGLMNACKAQAEEIILRELVYS